MRSGMRFGDAAAAQLMVGTCTITFFLSSAAIIFGMERAGLLVLTGGTGLDVLVGLSLFVFGACFVGVILAVVFPGTLKAIVRAGGRLLGPVGRSALRAMTHVRPWRASAEALLSRPGSVVARLELTADDLHSGVRVYLRCGKRAYLGALLVTWGFFGSRFAVAYVILLGLGIPTTPSSFVAWGPPILQVILIQALLNFALYVSPTPGASGIAEAGSIWLMAPWVRGVFELPYLVFWRLFALFSSMFVGGIYVFRYLGADVIEKRVGEGEANAKGEDG